MTDYFYEGYLAGYAQIGGRHTDPQWLEGYDRALDDKRVNEVNMDVYKRFHGKLPGESEITKQSMAQVRIGAE